jgi:iron complex outermembrane receptor protein
MLNGVLKTKYIWQNNGKSTLLKTITLQSGKITSSSDPKSVDKKIWRQPDVQFRIAPSYNFHLNNDMQATIYGAARYAGARWNDRDNSYQLDPYTKIDAGVGVSTASGITFILSGDNLTDSHGLTEGDPRDPLAKNGRPLLGRSFRFSIEVGF